MATKNFRGGVETLLGGSADKGVLVKQGKQRGRPKTNLKIITKTSQAGTKENETRATFIVNEERLEAVKALAHWERISIKEVLAQAIEAHLSAKRRELPKAMDLYKSKLKVS